MGRKIDKSRKQFTYSGDPQSYWKFAENRKPSSRCETRKQIKARKERHRDLDRIFAAALAKKAQARKLERKKAK